MADSCLQLPGLLCSKRSLDDYTRDVSRTSGRGLLPR